MPINYVTAVKNTRMTAVLNAIDAGGAAGKVNIYTAAYGALLVSVPLDFPCGAVAAGVLTFAGLPNSGIATGNGTAAIARILDSADTVVAEGLTVGTGAHDIVIDNTNIAVGQTVNLNSGAITHG